MFDKIYEVTYYNGCEIRDMDLFTSLDLAVDSFLEYEKEALICEYRLKKGQLLPTPLIERHPKGTYDYWGETGEKIYNKIMENKQ